MHQCDSKMFRKYLFSHGAYCGKHRILMGEGASSHEKLFNKIAPTPFFYVLYQVQVTVIQYRVPVPVPGMYFFRSFYTL